jgi:hypothetical protein
MLVGVAPPRAGHLPLANLPPIPPPHPSSLPRLAAASSPARCVEAEARRTRQRNRLGLGEFNTTLIESAPLPPSPDVFKTRLAAVKNVTLVNGNKLYVEYVDGSDAQTIPLPSACLGRLRRRATAWKPHRPDSALQPAATCLA